MSTFSEFLGHDHGHCDELFAVAEQAADARDVRATDVHARFVEAMEHHMRLEEEILFPAFEAATGSSMGPTAVMRHRMKPLHLYPWLESEGFGSDTRRGNEGCEILIWRRDDEAGGRAARAVASHLAHWQE